MSAKGSKGSRNSRVFILDARKILRPATTTPLHASIHFTSSILWPFSSLSRMKTLLFLLPLLPL
jgi:hypothetical protein